MVKQAVCFAHVLSESAPSDGSLFSREVIQRSFPPHDQMHCLHPKAILGCSLQSLCEEKLSVHYSVKSDDCMKGQISDSDF